jgi:glycerol kinase
LCFGTIDSWLAWKLTDGAHHITDVSNASRTLLLNLRSGDWDDWMLNLLGIPRACLPKVLPSSLPAGISARIEGGELPLGALVGDQQAALFGQTCFTPGMAKNTYGTGCYLLLHVGHEPLASKHRLLTTIAASPGKLEYALEGSVFTGGATVQWLRDGLGIIDKASDVEALASKVADHGGVYLVPAFTGLGSPYWDPHARGLMIGITRGTTRGHIARAALEAIAFQSAELLRCMTADAGQALKELRVDRVAQRPDDAVPGRFVRCSGRQAEGNRDHRAGRGLSGRTRHRLLAVARRAARQLAGRSPLRAAHVARPGGGAHQ